jgi:hypothetical protein
MYIPDFIKIGSGIQKLTHRQHGDLMSLLLFYSFNEGIRLKLAFVWLYRKTASFMDRV